MIALHSHCNRYENHLPYFLKQLAVPVLKSKSHAKRQPCQRGTIRQSPTSIVIVRRFFGTVLAHIEYWQEEASSEGTRRGEIHQWFNAQENH